MVRLPLIPGYNTEQDRQKSRQLLTQMGADLVGFGDVSGLAPDGYQKAVVSAIALPLEIIDEIPVGPTPEYLQTYKDYNHRLEEMSRAAAAFFWEFTANSSCPQTFCTSSPTRT